MAKTIPMIITNNTILVKEKDTNKFVTFDMPGIEDEPNIPFYHQFANKIAENQYKFKDFMKKLYGKKTKRYVLAIIVPDDTSVLEQIFIKEFFLNSDACKGVAQLTMGQILSKEDSKYLSLSRTSRNIVLQYINNGEILAKRLYDTNHFDAEKIAEDAKIIHIDIEYNDVPLYINNFNINMEDFTEFGIVVSTKDFLNKVAKISTEKV